VRRGAFLAMRKSDVASSSAFYAADFLVLTGALRAALAGAVL
jgi:hypothetical protein